MVALNVFKSHRSIDQNIVFEGLLEIHKTAMDKH
jgi:hypothetical protein